MQSLLNKIDEDLQEARRVINKCFQNLLKLRKKEEEMPAIE